jgi:hypothetical protein
MDPNHLWWTVFLSCIACIFSFFCYACSMLHFILLRTIPPWYNSIYFHCITCKHLPLFIILGITWSMHCITYVNRVTLHSHIWYSTVHCQ